MDGAGTGTKRSLGDDASRRASWRRHIVFCLCGPRGRQVEHGVVWEELKDHFTDGETGAQRKDEPY